MTNTTTLFKRSVSVLVLLYGVFTSGSIATVNAQDDATRNILKQGLLGAGTGAIASGASGGKAGKGALIGAGTNVIGGALLDTLFGSGSQGQPAPGYAVPYSSAPGPGAYYAEQPVYYQAAPVYYAPPVEDPNKKILKQGLLGAGTGAIASGASGGKAGKGALIGAGTNVIGGALLDTLTGSSSQGQAVPMYAQPYNAPMSSNAYYVDQPTYYQAAPVYYAPPVEDPNKKILKQGLLGAGTGAIASGASGGKAGKGALIGAGTNVIGGAVLDMLSEPQRPQPVYYAPPNPSATGYAPQKRIIRKFDSSGNIVSEEEFWR